jgi:multisubunit Na+/H+ antiporter MnhF subunit
MMNKLYTALLWLLTAFFISGAIQWVIDGSMVLAILALVAGIFFSPPVLKRLFG